MLINGRIAPIVGGNAMDATMVNISDIPEAKIGDDVVLLGRQGEEVITAMMLADWGNTVTYEILSRWNERMDRVYT